MTGSATAVDLIADGLCTEVSGELRLLGARCAECGVTTFPPQPGCPRCGAESMAEIPLGRRGTLWTFTTQDFPLKAPYTGPAGASFEPFTVGYVALLDGVIVEARLTEPDPDVLRIGMPMELTLIPFRRADGPDVTSFAFRPAN